MCPKKFYGQHFLYQPFYFHTIIQALELQPEDKIMEIGTGPARLTEYLLKAGADLWGIEIDKDMEAPLLRLKENYPRFSYSIQDFLTLQATDMIKINKIVGNLPYHLTIPILEKVIFESQAMKIVFLLAESTALRFMALPGSEHYSSASVLAQSFFEIEKVLFIDRRSFFPPPKIDSILVKFSRKSLAREITIKELHFYKLLFANRRKILLNCLANTVSQKDKWIDWLQELDLNPKERIENLTISDLQKLFMKAKEYGLV